MFKLPLDLVTTILALFGGAARYFQLVLEGRKFLWVELLAHLFIGGFTGLSMAKMGAIMGFEETALQVIAAWGGVIGLKAFELVEAYIIKQPKK